MKISITKSEYSEMWSYGIFNCPQEDQIKILASFPAWSDFSLQDKVEWKIPDDYVEIVRDMAFNLNNKTVYEKMESQTIRGTLKINFGEAFLNE